mmetsp:Transcript_73267/g.212207  ORF Transcript_73267/g.212207 Transcript_73267/m.212207 type:complete len:350 (+) Transcript_73267:135-1184(+)
MPSAPDLQSEDYYKVLGVDRGASDSEIAKAYKRLALKFHPDKNPDNKDVAENNFKIITEAYEVLHDPEKRKKYDQFGKAGAETGSNMTYQQADEMFKAFFGTNDPFSMFFDDDDGGGFRGMLGGGPGGRVFFNGPGRGGPSMGGMPFDLPGMGGGMGGMPGGFPGGMFGAKGGSKGSQRRAAPPQWAMPAGTQVIVRDLAKAQEHNGKLGTIQSFDQGKGRYEVELSDSSTVSLRPVNLTQLCDVKVVGIESQPELNGASGQILSYSESSGRYTVKLRQKLASGRDCVGLEPSKVVLSSGTRVVVQGLSNQQFNGLMGIIVDTDNEAMRHTVQCQNGKQIKIKFDNVIC